MAELKEKGVPSTERMGEVNKLWKMVSDAEKSTWKAKADEHNIKSGLGKKTKQTGGLGSASSTAKKNKTTKLNGYHLFIKEKMPDVKADTSVAAKERMTKLGQLWKALNADEQSDFKQRAEAINQELEAGDNGDGDGEAEPEPEAEPEEIEADE